MRGADDVDASDGDVVFSCAQFWSFAFGSGDWAPDIAAEKITHPLALTQTVDHRVEITLQFTKFGLGVYPTPGRTLSRA
ncbi:hypothetical protein [Mycobacterium lepromatosis]|uniref:hypothetical protein n=1 Tax=Mycobacterium lepromatosis TaxID=480418 RepID=UPI0005F83E21|nr:hypothetical protein [Mycobacterium lepromatosis]